MRSRYVEEWVAILSEPSLTSSELRALWREALTFSLVLTGRRFLDNWKIAAAVLIVALFISPFWLVTLLPLFLFPRANVE